MMKMAPKHKAKPHSPEPASLLLRRAEQSAIALLTLLSFLVLVGCWLTMQTRRGGVIEFERAPRGAIEFVVDINSADWPELMLLPDIGETLARRVVESRQADGPFRDLNDLQRVRGIGPKTVERVRPYLSPLPDSETLVGN